MKNDRKRVKNVDGKDRLSDLHDDILIHIQSFLDVKSAAQTCVLSRRWNNKLWIHHPDVYLNSKTFVKAVIKFRKFADRVLNRKTLVKALLKFQKFVDMVLAQRDKLHLKTRYLSFTWEFEYTIPQKLLDKVHAYVQYHDVRHFDLSICCDSRYRRFPSQTFNPKSLTILRLNLLNWNEGWTRTAVNHRNLQLYLSGCTALKTLWLEHISCKVSRGTDVDLFSSLVDLTELHIIGCCITTEFSRPFLVRAPRLERLTILQNISWPQWDLSSRVLKYLRMDFPFLNRTINPLPDYIEELEIEFNFPSLTNYKTADIAKCVINKISGLPRAKSVTLSKSTLQVISAFPEIFESGDPVTVPQFKWEFLKVLTRNELPTNEFPEYRPGLAALMKNCSKTLKVEFV